MFPKNLTALKIADMASREKLTEEALKQNQFVPPSTHQTQAFGWDVVHEEGFSFTYQGFTLLSLKVAKKTVPGSAVKEATKLLAAEWQKAQGHWPGKKKLKELKEQVTDELMVRAIPATKSIM